MALKEQPQQKEFLASIEDFETKLLVVTMLSLIVTAFGILGYFLCHSVQLHHLAYVALGLNLNWIIGFFLANRVKWLLDKISHTNLNGYTSFEFLMLFCQMQILLLVFIYLYLLLVIRNILIELKEMDVLAAKDNGYDFDKQYDQMNPSTVQAVMVSFAVIQILLILVIVYFLFRFGQKGILWSNKQM